jgi:hypothetical protein
MGEQRCLAGVGREQVQVRMPLGQISSCGDRDDEAGEGVLAAAPRYPARGTMQRRPFHGPASIQPTFDTATVAIRCFSANSR